MTVKELIEMLQDYDGDAEVRLAMQPNWPMQYEVGELVEVDLSDPVPGYEDEEPDEAEPTPVVYIGEGSQHDDPYLPLIGACALGWHHDR